jgi:hypothetical protein
MKLATPILMIAAAIGLFFLFVNPKFAEVKALQAQGVEYDSAIQRATATVAKKDQLLTKYNSFKPEDITRLRTFLPDTIDTIQLIIDVNAIANTRQSKIESIKVTADAPGKAAIGGVADTRKHGTAVMDFKVSMTYETFQLFLKDLEQSLRLIDVGSVGFSPNTEGGNVYDYSVSLKTYYLK